VIFYKTNPQIITQNDHKMEVNFTLDFISAAEIVKKLEDSWSAIACLVACVLHQRLMRRADGFLASVNPPSLEKARKN
jgi:hypothetical protein